MRLPPLARTPAAPALGALTGFVALGALWTGSQGLLAADAVLAMATGVSAGLPVRSRAAAVDPTPASPPPAPEPADPATLGAPRGLRAGSEALYDPETGLLNDAYFRATLRERVASARRSLRPITVVFLRAVPLDRDRPLSSAEAVIVARVLRSTLRDSDTVCRLDRGRFALLLDDTNDTAAVIAVDRAIGVLRREEETLQLRAGIAGYPTHGLSVSEVVAHAEQALVAASRRSDTPGIEIARTGD